MMSRPAKRIPGCDFLYERGRRFTVRVQVPRDVRAALGQGEFKTSLDGDLALAKRKYHSVVAGFIARIETARCEMQTVNRASIASTAQPTSEDLEVACYAHFLRMVDNMRGKVAQPVGDNPRILSKQQR